MELTPETLADLAAEVVVVEEVVEAAEAAAEVEAVEAAEEEEEEDSRLTISIPRTQMNLMMTTTPMMI